MELIYVKRNQALVGPNIHDFFPWIIDSNRYCNILVRHFEHIAIY